MSHTRVLRGRPGADRVIPNCSLPWHWDLSALNIMSMMISWLYMQTWIPCISLWLQTPLQLSDNLDETRPDEATEAVSVKDNGIILLLIKLELTFTTSWL